MNITLLLENTTRSKKPMGKEIGVINNNLLKSTKTFDIKELALEISENGKTAVLMNIKDKNGSLTKDNFKDQQVIMLDIDNTTEDVEKYGLLTVDDVLNDVFIRENANFIYETFSSTKEVPKFRIVFVLREPISDKDVIENYYLNLLERYKQADIACKDVTRKFFGSNNSFTEVNFNNYLDTSTFTIKKKEKVTKRKTINNKIINEITVNKPVYLELKDLGKLVEDKKGEFSMEFLRLAYKIRANIQTKFGNTLSRTYISLANARTVLKATIDIREFLDLPRENPFLDIFRVENNPSASVIYSDKEGINSLYYTHNNNKTLDLFQIISKLTGLNLTKTIDLLLILTNSSIDANTDLAMKTNNIRLIRAIMLDEDFKTSYKEISRFLGNDLDIAIAFLDLFVDNAYEDNETGEIRQLLFKSNFKLTKEINNYLGKLGNPKTKSSDKIIRTIDKLAVIDVVYKLEDNNIPKDLLKKYADIEYAKKTKSKNITEDTFLRVNVLELNNNADIDDITDIILELYSKKFTNKALNFEGLSRILGLEKAKQVYPQIKNSQNNKGISTDADGLSDAKKSVETKMSMYILKKINEKGYCTTKELDLYTRKSILKKNVDVTRLLNQLRSSITEAYDLDLVKVNKVVREKHNLPSEIKSNSYIYVAN